MSQRTTLKLVFALGGLVLFGLGIRFSMDGLRWAGIAAVAVAWLMRFGGRPAAPPPQD